MLCTCHQRRFFPPFIYKLVTGWVKFAPKKKLAEWNLIRFCLIAAYLFCAWYPLLPCCPASIVYFRFSASLSYSLTSYPQFWPVKLNANRVVIGTLRGFDQFMNLVVDNTVEVNGNDKNDIGMVVSYFLFFALSNALHTTPFGILCWILQIVWYITER